MQSGVDSCIPSSHGRASEEPVQLATSDRAAEETDVEDQVQAVVVRGGPRFSLPPLPRIWTEDLQAPARAVMASMQRRKDGAINQKGTGAKPNS